MKSTLAIALLVSLWVSSLNAHSFYSSQCCNERDCSPFARERVKLVEQGYIIDGNFIIGHLDNRLRETPLDEIEPYHLCKRVNENAVSDKNTRCLYVPQMGF